MDNEIKCHASGCTNLVATYDTYCEHCCKKRRTDHKELIKKTWNGERTNWNLIRPPKRFWGATWDTLSRQLQEQIIPFIAGDMELLTLLGPAGAGKSWTAWATISAFLVDHHTNWNSPRYINWFDLNEVARDARLFGDTGEANRDCLGKLRGCELLIIDEFATARPYEAEFMGVMGVIHSRFDNGRPTILITTKSEPELMESVGEAVVSRMNSGIVVRMQGRDRRRPT